MCESKQLHVILQALSKAEGGTKNELNSLEAEADMPLEQLLAQYGYVTGHQGASSDGNADQNVPESSSGGAHQGKATARAESTGRPTKRQRTSTKGNAHSSKPAEVTVDGESSAAQHSTAQPTAQSELESDSDQSSADLRDLVDNSEAATAVDARRATTSSPRLALPTTTGTGSAAGVHVTLPKEEMDKLASEHSESDFDSVAGSDAGVDDEQTLEEEERLANAEGAAHHVSPFFTLTLTHVSPAVLRMI